MKLIPLDNHIKVIEVGATNYKGFGWASEMDLPKFETVREIADFLEKEEDIGLIHFEADVENVGKLSTHDDGECHFMLYNKTTAIELIKKASPDAFSECLLAKLLNSKGMYVDIDTIGRMNEYHTFDHYIKNKNRT